MKEIIVESWEELTPKIDEFGEQQACSDRSLVFRGQSNASWRLTTTLERKLGRVRFKDYYRTIAKIRPQIESLTTHHWDIPEFTEVYPLGDEYDKLDVAMWSGRCPAYDYMVYLRHHGFPSPLLDWTRSLYVAAYFAFATASAADKHVAIFVLAHQPNKMSGNGIPTIYRYGPYVKTHRRHFLQQSEYTICMFFDEQWWFEPYYPVFEEGRHQQGRCQKFMIPTSEREKVLKVLDEHNLNAFSLFGSEESMLETLASRELMLIRPTSLADRVLPK